MGDAARRRAPGTFEAVRLRRCLVVAVAVALVGSCTRASDDSGSGPDPVGEPDVTVIVTESTAEPSTSPSTSTTVPDTTTPATTAPATTEPDTTEPTETSAPPTTIPESVPATSSPGSTPPGSSLPPGSDPPTTMPPDAPVHDPACVVVVQPGEWLTLIAERIDDDTVTVESIIEENSLTSDQLNVGQLLDVCVDNGVDDVEGSALVDGDVIATELANVERQQAKLNELFVNVGIRELLVDGVSGPVTRQRLCAFRLAAGLPPTLNAMAAGSEEEQLLMATATLPIPFTSAVNSERWILIDQTCQIMFVGEAFNRLVYVFPTSTGSAGFETRPQNLTRMYRYNPAHQNGGWHNSSTYPAADDNPLNGNMYRPMYFDRGQAIHGAQNVPTSPQSKGCARLRVEHHDLLIAWLGLTDVPGPFESRSQLNVTVNVQGAYVPPVFEPIGGPPPTTLPPVPATTVPPG